MTSIGTKFILADRFTFDPTSNSLVDKHVDNDVVRLGSNESRILLLLSLRPNEVVTRNELYDFVWREQGFEVDDSSLTQAISTLRKMLKDSTKSPQFVKTVPKRGYQFIASVESLSSETKSQSNDDLEQAPLAEEDTDTSVDVADLSVKTTQEPALSPIPTQTHYQAPPAQKESIKRTDILTKFLIFAAIILPLCVVLVTNPSQSKFRHLATYDGVVVNTPINHPDLTEWLPSIEMCIDKYISKYQGEFALEKVIATGGHNDLLVMNYIHKPEYSSANVTLRIVANQSEINKVCQ